MTFIYTKCIFFIKILRERKVILEIKLASKAGFCYGVDRAVGMVYDLLEKGIKAATLGPIIHNPHIVRDLESKGVIVAKKVEDIPKDYVMVLRSHGVPKSVIDELDERGIDYVDATCPFVKKIHRLAAKIGDEGKVLILAGDESHAEIQGIIGHCQSEHYVVKDSKELEELLKNNSHLENSPVVLSAQTTFNTNEWENCLKTLKKLCTKGEIFDTICNATVERQAEAKEIAQDSDAMIVVGGKESSNTAKLHEICQQYCKSYLIEEADELPILSGDIKVGITAGASTPASLIKEVLVTMTDVNQNSEQNFAEMLEESLKNFNTDEKVRGVVVGITPTEVFVDVGRKQAGFIPANEISQDPNVRPEDAVKIGDEIELLIMKTNDQEGTIMLSKKRVDAMKGWDEIEEAKDNDTVLTGKVIEVVKGGLIVLKDAMRIFIPASQASATRGEDLNALKGQEVSFRVIEVNRQRRRAVGSIRSVLREQIQEQQQKFWSEIEEGSKYTGKVKSLTNFGAFVDLGGVDGMIHISELSWNRVKHPSEVVSVGDTVNVYVKSVDKENRKISLGYKDPSDNPWERLKTDYPIGTICEAKIVGMTQFGAFANILPGIDGLIHISQIADRRIDKPQDVLQMGEKVMVKVTDINFEDHRVSLSIRALIEEDKEEDDKKAAEGPAQEIVYQTDKVEPVEEKTTEPEKAEAQVEALSEETSETEE